MPVYNPKTIALHYRTGASVDPVDAETLYWGGGLIPLTVEGVNLFALQACRIIRADYFVYRFGAAATTETSSAYVRVNATTDHLISSSVQHDAMFMEAFVNASMNVNIATSDTVEFKIVNPTWATNPTVVFYGCSLHLELP